MHKQLVLLHNAVSAYFSGNAVALESTLMQFNIKVATISPTLTINSFVASVLIGLYHVSVEITEHSHRIVAGAIVLHRRAPPIDIASNIFWTWSIDPSGK